MAFEMAKSDEQRWRRLAALALAESGDSRGEADLVAWWMDGAARDYTRSRELLDAFSKIRSTDAVWPLTKSLTQIRLRPHIADTLAAVGSKAARVPLARALAKERYQGSRIALARALVKLGAEGELVEPLVRFMGVPDPLPGGLGFALRAGVLQHVGGPSGRQLRRLARHHEIGVAVDLVVPRGGNGKGVRALVRVRTAGPRPGQVTLGARVNALKYDTAGKPIRRRGIPRLDANRSVKIAVPATEQPIEVHAVLPPSMHASAGRATQVVVFSDPHVQIEAVALVPLADELPPPAPEPWELKATEPGRESSR